MVRAEGAATAKGAQGTHQGQDRSLVSSDFRMALKVLPDRPRSVE
jgi:hypothetical protein